MTSASKKGYPRGEMDERPIRLDHALVGEEEMEGSSVDGVSIESYGETEILMAHPLSMLLYLTTKEGYAIPHSAFGKEAV